MPRSKRDKEVSLTKTKKKGRVAKEKLVSEIRDCLPHYTRAFLFSVDHMRTAYIKKLRQEFKTDSRFFFGKNSVMGLALGRIREEEAEKGLHKLASRLVGQCGLIFTNRPEEDIIQYFKSFSTRDFARAGNAAAETVELVSGPLPQFPFSLEPRLRKLGLPTELRKGVVGLLSDHTVCKEGDVLTSDQAQILKLLGEEQAEFKVKLLACWTKGAKFRAYVKKRPMEG